MNLYKLKTQYTQLIPLHFMQPRPNITEDNYTLSGGYVRRIKTGSEIKVATVVCVKHFYTT